MASGINWGEVAQGAKAALTPLMDPSGIGSAIRDNAPGMVKGLKDLMLQGQARGKTSDQVLADVQEQINTLLKSGQTPRETPAELGEKAKLLGQAQGDVTERGIGQQARAATAALPILERQNQLYVDKLGGVAGVQGQYYDGAASREKDVYGFKLNESTKQAMALLQQAQGFGGQQQDRVLGSYNLDKEAGNYWNFQNKQLDAGIALANKQPGFVDTVKGLAPVGIMLASLLGGLN